MYLESVPRETAWLYAIYENKPMNYFPPIFFFEKKTKPKSNWFFSKIYSILKKRNIWRYKKRVIMTSKVVWDRYFLLWRIRNTARGISYCQTSSMAKIYTTRVWFPHLTWILVIYSINFCPPDEWAPLHSDISPWPTYVH